MAQLIIIIIIVIWIYQRKKKAQEERPDDHKNQNRNRNVTTAGQPVRDLFMDKKNVSPGQTQQRMPSKTKVEAMKEDGHTTTAYLQEKADADAREHAMEKYEEQRRQQDAGRGMTPAERLYPGDSVPQGRRCVICGYCAAENLVPMVPRTKYSCYFCREPLN
jgi:hypothetical protein